MEKLSCFTGGGRGNTGSCISVKLLSSSSVLGSRWRFPHRRCDRKTASPGYGCRRSSLGTVVRMRSSQKEGPIDHDAAASPAPVVEYKPGFLDDTLMAFFRSKLVQELGWDSDKSGYDGLIEVVNHLMTKGENNEEIEGTAVRVLQSMFPPFLLVLFKGLIAPIGEGKIAAMMIARATMLSCQWLMGRCSVNSVDLPDGSVCTSGVFVERCRYLEKSRCAGVCINTCKIPSQTFFREFMGVPLLMDPNFEDYSCQFKFGVPPPPRGDDKSLSQPCLEICPNANRRKEIRKNVEAAGCPKV